MKYTFLCTLWSTKEIEEQFELVMEEIGLATAKNKIDQFLFKEWGSITKRIYRNENMRSERYWGVELKRVEILKESK